MFDNGDNVGIGTINPGFRLDVAGVIRASNVSPSDERLKTNINLLINVLEKLEQLRGVSFQWNEAAQALGHASGQSDIGVIAQEVETVFPELVYTSNTDGYKAVDY
ncbi:MAG: tail fiber domain-containing protein, partial [Acidobacteria bacterium]|nr:tail fiber domain-containing protein [Acidobacteriota bacterium]